MKTIAIIFFTLLSISSISQVERIESSTLDSLIWKKVNEYRISKGVSPFEAFEDSLMNQYSRRVTLSNSNKSIIEHSDSVGYYSNGECIYKQKIIGDIMEYAKYEYLANSVVSSWINSPSHEHIISNSKFSISTVTSILIINHNDSSLSLDTSLHTLLKDQRTFANYKYKIKKAK